MHTWLHANSALPERRDALLEPWNASAVLQKHATAQHYAQE